MTDTFAIIPFVPDLWVFLPAASAAWGYYKGSKRKRLMP